MCTTTVQRMSGIREDFNMEMGSDSDDEHIRSSSNISGQSMDEEKDNAIPEYNYEYSPSSDKNSLTNEQLERIQKIENATSNVRRVIEKYGNAPLPSLDPKDANGSWEIDADSAWSDPSVAVAEIVSAREELKSAWGDGENGGGGEGQQKQEWWKSILGDDETSKSNNSGEAKKHVDTKTEGDDEPLTKEEEKQFDAVYLEWTTNAFAEELEALRKGQLENLTSSRKQKKSVAAASGSAEVELDPTQYSFVVASKGKKKGKADDETAAAAAAEEIDVQVLADMLQSGGNFLSPTEKKMLLRARQRAKMRSDEKDPKDFVGLSLHERRRRELGFVVER